MVGGDFIIFLMFEGILIQLIIIETIYWEKRFGGIWTHSQIKDLIKCKFSIFALMMALIILLVFSIRK